VKKDKYYSNIVRQVPSSLELKLLNLIFKNGGQMLGADLKKESGASYGTVYMTMRRLVEKRWVKFTDYEAADGRVRMFHLEPRAERLLEALHS
jgi:DNA-binding MarR family transcriptional regulator